MFDRQVSRIIDLFTPEISSTLLINLNYQGITSVSLADFGITDASISGFQDIHDKDCNCPGVEMLVSYTFDFTNF